MPMYNMGDTDIDKYGRCPYNSCEVISMPDYKEMYLTMVRASEKAMNLLAEAQQKCEEMYISSEGGEPEQDETA